MASSSKNGGSNVPSSTTPTTRRAVPKLTLPTKDCLSKLSARVRDKQEEINKYAHKVCQKALDNVLLQYPSKIESLKKLHESFRTTLIGQLAAEDEAQATWVRNLMQSIKQAKSAAGSSSGNLAKGSFRCIPYTHGTPLLVESFEGVGPSLLAGGKLMVPTNESIDTAIRLLYPYLVDIMDNLSNLITVIDLLEPTLQEGNNFGLDVQAQTSGMIQGELKGVAGEFPGKCYSKSKLVHFSYSPF